MKNSIYTFTVEDINGKPFSLESLKGKKIMIVNTASKCGLTPQYKKLEALYQKYKDQNFVIVGFPANNFMWQEPGSNEDIKAFCEKNYGVSFPMMAKISVKGNSQHPLYTFLTKKDKNGVKDSSVKWNFQKYLIDENGHLAEVISPRTQPDDPVVLDWIKKLKMKIDILAIGAHPDDVELSCAGTLAKEMANGKQAAILDLTQGELGTRGTTKIRASEAKEAARILGVKARYNLNFADGFFKNDKAHQLQLATYIRFLKPEIVLCNAVTDRHPDHGRAATLVVESCFLSGLQQVKTVYDGQPQEAWRPKKVYHYIQWNEAHPDFVVDISSHMDTKLKAVNAYASQFFNPQTLAPETLISSQNFMDSVKYRAANMGRLIGVDNAEGFTATRLLAVDRINDLI